MVNKERIGYVNQYPGSYSLWESLIENVIFCEGQRVLNGHLSSSALSTLAE